MFSGSYDDLTNKPALFDGTWASLGGKPIFQTVAYSGSYHDLEDLPVLFSGNYNDLTNKPVLFDGTWTSLSGKPDFATVATSVITSYSIHYTKLYDESVTVVAKICLAI